MGKKAPADFPRDDAPTALAETRPGVFEEVVLAEELIYERYLTCENLVPELVKYTHRKLAENRTWTREEYWPKLRHGLSTRGWGLTPLELTWVMQRVQSAFEPCSKSQ